MSSLASTVPAALRVWVAAALIPALLLILPAFIVATEDAQDTPTTAQALLLPIVILGLCAVAVALGTLSDRRSGR